VAQAAKGDSPFDHRYEKVALFGHSLGTLGIRQTLCARFKASSRFYDALHSITFFGTPLNGSPLALFCPFYKIADALQPANPQIRMLRVWAESTFDRDPWPTAKVVLGQGDWVVGQSFKELVRWPGDEQPVDQKAFLDHRDLSKPNAWTDCAVTSYIRSALRRPPEPKRSPAFPTCRRLLREKQPSWPAASSPATHGRTRIIAKLFGLISRSPFASDVTSISANPSMMHLIISNCLSFRFKPVSCLLKLYDQPRLGR
jgi:hypothetical protein